MRCVIEGQSLYKVRGDLESDSEEEDKEENEWETQPGVVYQLMKGRLKLLDGGMRQYETIAEKAMGALCK
jgi:hypothetical protein